MIADWPRIVVALLYCLLAVTTPGVAQSAWVLWVEAPAGSDQWSIAHIPELRFETNEGCQRRAQDFNDLELSIAKMERTSAEAGDLFTCLPDTVDPRPERALRPDTVDPRGPKGK